MVEGTTPRGPYLLLASGLDDQSANLPLTAALIPLPNPAYGPERGTDPNR